MSDEERRLRNGDKRVQPGYSSSGIKLPTREERLKEFEEKKARLETYRSYRHSSGSSYSYSSSSHTSSYDDDWDDEVDDDTWYHDEDDTDEKYEYDYWE